MHSTRKLRVLFLDSSTFLKREMLNALRRRGDVQLFTAAIPQRLPAGQADAAFRQVRRFLPALVFTLNEAGFDGEGRLFDLIAATGSYFVNWYYDDPRYDYVFWGRRPRPSPRRLDFVTEPAWEPGLAALGYAPRFLPLATDPAYFNTAAPAEPQRDVAFVGSSTLEFLDGLVTPDLAAAMERHAALLAECRELYDADPRASVRDHLLSRGGLWRGGPALDEERFLFAMEWMVGYLYRRDFIVELAALLGRRFTCYGDAGWTRFIDPAQVSADACYYDNLCRCYRSTRINININRIHTPTAFTQRVFDCKASGAFLLTEKRQLNAEYFRVSGEGRELVEFASRAECRGLIDHYLAQEEERAAIAEAGRERVLREHTYDSRLQSVLDACAAAWGW